MIKLITYHSAHFMVQDVLTSKTSSSVKNILRKQAFLSVIFTQSQLFNYMFIFNGKLHYCNNSY